MPNRKNENLRQFVESYNEFTTKSRNVLYKLLESGDQELLLAVLEISSSPTFNYKGKIKPYFDLQTKIDLRIFAIQAALATNVFPYLTTPIDETSPETIVALSKTIKTDDVFNCIKDLGDLITQHISDVKAERSGWDCVLDFLKACVNFLIDLLNLGNRPNFFKSSTWPLEELKTMQQQLTNLHEQLTPAEKDTDLIIEPYGLALPEDSPDSDDGAYYDDYTALTYS